MEMTNANFREVFINTLKDLGYGDCYEEYKFSTSVDADNYHGEVGHMEFDSRYGSIDLYPIVGDNIYGIGHITDTDLEGAYPSVLKTAKFIIAMSKVFPRFMILIERNSYGMVILEKIKELSPETWKKVYYTIEEDFQVTYSADGSKATKFSQKIKKYGYENNKPNSRTLGELESEQDTWSSKILEAAKLFSLNNYEFITEEELIKRNSETVTSVRNTVYILDKNKKYIKAQVADCVYLEDGFHGIVTKITDKLVIVENGEEKRKIEAIWEEPPTNLLHRKGGEVFLYDNVTGKCYGQFGLATIFKYTDMSKNKEEMYLGCIGDIVYISIQSDKDFIKTNTDTSSYITVMGKQGPIGFENAAVTEMIKFKPYTAIKEGETYGNVRFITRVNE